MFGNITKAKILEYFYQANVDAGMKHIADGNKLKPPPLYVPNIAVLNNVKGNKELINKYLLILHLDGYITFEETENRDIWTGQLTTKGIHAIASNYFREEEAKSEWKLLIDAIMAGATFAIAIATIVTLLQDKGELGRLENKIEQLESKKGKNVVKPNPSTPIPKNEGQANPSDSVK